MARTILEYEWRALGELSVDEGRTLVFPAAKAVPAVYALRFAADRQAHEYVGETEDLRRRLHGYRTPGPTQPTNLRINARLHRALAENVGVELFVVDSARISTDTFDMVPLDLTRKAGRLLVESAALLASSADVVLNAGYSHK